MSIIIGEYIYIHLRFMIMCFIEIYSQIVNWGWKSFDGISDEKIDSFKLPAVIKTF